MAKKDKKLNAMRVLEQHSIPYEVFEFSPDIHSAEGVAETLGLPPASVFKTLVTLKSDGKPVLAIIPGPAALDLKALAGVVGEKKMVMAPHADAERLTGLKVGGISPLALLQKRWPVVLDASAQQYPAIVISAGQRGTNLRIPTTPLIELLEARCAALTRAAE